VVNQRCIRISSFLQIITVITLLNYYVAYYKATWLATKHRSSR